MVHSGVHDKQTVYFSVSGKTKYEATHGTRVSGIFSTLVDAQRTISKIENVFSEIKTVIDSFGSHLNVDLQQRGVEFSQLFRAHSNLRPALLEKMPPMQITRVANQNGDSPEENGGIELIENGLDDLENVRPAPISESVSLVYTRPMAIQLTYHAN